MSLWVLKTRSLRGYLQTQIAAWGFVGAWVHLVLTRAAAGLEGALGASATRPTRGGKDSRDTGRARFSLCLDPGHAEEESAIRRAILPEERSAEAQEQRGGAQLLAEKGKGAAPAGGSGGRFQTHAAPWAASGGAHFPGLTLAVGFLVTHSCHLQPRRREGVYGDRPQGKARIPSVWLCPRCRARRQQLAEPKVPRHPQQYPARDLRVAASDYRAGAIWGGRRD